MQYLCFCDWLIFFSMICSRFIMLSHMAEFSSFSRLNNISLCKYFTFSLSIHLSTLRRYIENYNVILLVGAKYKQNISKYLTTIIHHNLLDLSKTVRLFNIRKPINVSHKNNWLGEKNYPHFKKCRKKHFDIIWHPSMIKIYHIKEYLFNMVKISKKKRT